MREFKVGDTIEMLEDCSECEKGKRYVLALNKHKTLCAKGPYFPDTACECQDKWKLITEATMSKYEEIKAKIEGLNNGWTKEADDILQEIMNDKTWHDGWVEIAISCHNCESIFREIQIRHVNSINKLAGFSYKSQCEKNRAFKSALLWLLDHSGIKKDLVGQEVKAEIEGKTYKVKILEEA